MPAPIQTGRTRRSGERESSRRWRMRFARLEGRSAMLGTGSEETERTDQPATSARQRASDSGRPVRSTAHSSQSRSDSSRSRRQATQLSGRSEEHTSELQSQSNLVCRLLLEKKKGEIKVHIKEN